MSKPKKPTSNQKPLEVRERRICYLLPPASPVRFANPSTVPSIRCGKANEYWSRDRERVNCPECRDSMGWPSLAQEAA